ncbi:hypothetical protein PENTCL1PPCAC_7040, partial [Pristionchus entomophagus]
AVDPLQEVSDLKRKLRLIKGKLLDPTERNLRQAINMIDDTFATEEVQMKCSRIGITCAPPPMFAVPGYPFLLPESPVHVNPKENKTTTLTDAQTQTIQPEMCTSSVQTSDTGDICSFSKSAFYNVTQANIQKAIDILTETNCTLADRGKKLKSDGSSAKSKLLSPIDISLCNSIKSCTQSLTPTTPTGRPGVTHMQRVQRFTERTPVTTHMLRSSEKLAIEYTPMTDKTFDPVTAAKRQKINEFDFHCNYCSFRGDSEVDLFYHDCTILPQMESPFVCCGTAYKHRGYYTRHRDNKHRLDFFTR